MAKSRPSGARRKADVGLLRDPAEDIKILRKEIRAFAIKKFAGTSVSNSDSGMEIKITSKGIKEATSGFRRAEELQAVKKLPQMLKRAKYKGSEANLKMNPGVKQYHIFESALTVNSVKYNYTLKIRELQDGNYFYDSYTKK